MLIDLLEALMIFSWGVSWPILLRKSFVSRTAKGKSMVFEIFTLSGYIFGITRKFLQLNEGGSFNFLWYLAFVFYFINFTFIFLDWLLWFRNHKLDLKRENGLEV